MHLQIDLEIVLKLLSLRLSWVLKRRNPNFLDQISQLKLRSLPIVATRPIRARSDNLLGLLRHRNHQRIFKPVPRSSPKLIIILRIRIFFVVHCNGQMALFYFLGEAESICRD